ncbi:MAG: hypothetical protein SOX37_07520 [Sodaliphilus sp.]|nr:hypothetical protein [Sodaliphilus sp.]
MVDIQYDTTIMGGREVSRPYRVCFSPKASGFYPWGDATALAGEGGVGDVVCLIQASASNHKPKKSDMPHHQRQVRSTGIAKRLFFYVFVSVPQYFSTEPFSY